MIVFARPEAVAISSFLGLFHLRPSADGSSPAYRRQATTEGGMNSSKFSKIWYGVGILLLLNAATYIGLAQGGGKDYARLHFFYIGQGDSIYLRTVEGNDVL